MEFSHRPPIAKQPITRNRTSLSCSTCRRRKVKCDKVHPICGNCMRNGDHCTFDLASHRTSNPEDFRDDGNPESNISQSALSFDRNELKRRRKTDSIEGNRFEASSPYSGENGSLHQPPSVDPSTSELSQDIGSKLDRLTAMVDHLSRTRSPEVAGMSKKNNHSKRKSTARRSVSHEGPRIPQGLSNEVLHSQTGLSLGSNHSEDESSSDQREPIDNAADIVDNLSMGHLSLQEGGRSRYIGSTYWAYMSDEISELNQLLRDRTRYYPSDICNSAPTPSVVEEKTTTRDYLESYDGYIPSSDMGRYLDKSILFRTTQSPEPSRFATLGDNILDGLPINKHQCHILYRCYISGVHTVFPLGHPPRMLQWYDEFWHWYDHRETHRAPYTHLSFIPLLFAILYGGSVSCSVKIVEAEFAGTSRLSLSTQLHDRVTRSLSLLSFATSPSMPALMAFCIVQTILCREEEPLTSSLFVSLALRVAQNMGLHQEPSKFGIDPIEAETRRRVWWHIVWMDTLVSNSTGWPPSVISESFWDVKDVSELKDRLIGTQDGDNYLDSVQNGSRQPDRLDDPLQRDHCSHVSVVHVMALGRYRVIKFLRKIIEIQLGVKPIGFKEFQAMKRLLQDITEESNQRINRIPRGTVAESDQIESSQDHLANDYATPREIEEPWKNALPEENLLKVYSIQYHRRTWLAYHEWARTLLELSIHKVFCIVLQPFLKNIKSKAWGDDIRKLALEHAHGYIQKFLSLTTNPTFQPFTWDWPGSHQPLHAIMILLVDLHNYPFSPEAVQSRSHIDKTFLLSGPDGGVPGGEDGTCNLRPLHEGGRETWDMLRRLRQKAWQKAGLDPDMLLVEPPTANKRQPEKPVQATDSRKSEANDSEFPTVSGPSINLEADMLLNGNSEVSGANTTFINVSNGINLPPVIENIDTPHDFDWEKWDANFGQYAPLDEDELNFQSENPWHFDQ